MDIWTLLNTETEQTPAQSLPKELLSDTCMLNDDEDAWLNFQPWTPMGYEAAFGAAIDADFDNIHAENFLKRVKSESNMTQKRCLCWDPRMLRGSDNFLRYTAVDMPGETSTSQNKKDIAKGETKLNETAKEIESIMMEQTSTRDMSLATEVAGQPAVNKLEMEYPRNINEPAQEVNSPAASEKEHASTQDVILATDAKVQSGASKLVVEFPKNISGAIPKENSSAACRKEHKSTKQHRIVLRKVKHSGATKMKHKSPKSIGTRIKKEEYQTSTGMQPKQTDTASYPAYGKEKPEVHDARFRSREQFRAHIASLERKYRSYSLCTRTPCGKYELRLWAFPMSPSQLALKKLKESKR